MGEEAESRRQVQRRSHQERVETLNLTPNRLRACMLAILGSSSTLQPRSQRPSGEHTSAPNPAFPLSSVRPPHLSHEP